MTTSNQFALPTEPQSVKTIHTDPKLAPLRARVFLYGLPKTWKTTLASQWAPERTIFLDLQHGTDLLPGEHFVQHIEDWDKADPVTPGFEQVINAIVAPGQDRFKTVIIDTADLAYKMADAHVAAKRGLVAAGLAEYGKGVAEAEGLFRRAIGKLLARRDLGVWFIGHAKRDIDDNGNERFVPELDKRVQLYVLGDCEHIFFTERVGNRTVLHTGGTGRFEGGSRLNLPATMDMDARKLYGAMVKGVRELTGTPAAVEAIPAESKVEVIPAEPEVAEQTATPEREAVIA